MIFALYALYSSFERCCGWIEVLIRDFPLGKCRGDEKALVKMCARVRDLYVLPLLEPAAIFDLASSHVLVLAQQSSLGLEDLSLDLRENEGVVDDVFKEVAFVTELGCGLFGTLLRAEEFSEEFVASFSPNW